MTEGVKAITSFDAIRITDDLLREIYQYGFEKPLAICREFYADNQGQRCNCIGLMRYWQNLYDCPNHFDNGIHVMKKFLIQNNEQLELVCEEIRVSSLFSHPNLLLLLDHAIIAVKMVTNELKKGSDKDGRRRSWEVALCGAYERADDALKDKSLEPYSIRTMASVVILLACQVIAANCGDYRVILYRGKQAIPFTVDHKLDREDAVTRIINGGRKIINWGCLKVDGFLAMTRATL